MVVALMRTTTKGEWQNDKMIRTKMVCCMLVCLWVFAWTCHLKNILPTSSRFNKTTGRLLAAVILGALTVVLDIWLEGFCLLCVFSVKCAFDRFCFRKLKVEGNALKWSISTAIGSAIYLTVGNFVQRFLA